MDGNRNTLHRPLVPAPPRSRATSLSEVAGGARPAARRFAALAWASLGLVSAAMSTGCLITDPPQFKPPKHSRPLLDATTADPDPGAVLRVEESEIQNGTKSAIKFSADVISQEDSADTGSAFQQLEAWLYIDYGSDADPLQPYSFAIRANKIQPASSSDQKRRVEATWRPGLQRVDAGCHTVTLVVSHIFDDSLCPVCSDDHSSITWQILRCDNSKGDCDAMPLTGPGACKARSNSCAKVRETLQDAGMEVAQCPEGETTDGGGP